MNKIYISKSVSYLSMDEMTWPIAVTASGFKFAYNIDDTYTEKSLQGEVSVPVCH